MRRLAIGLCALFMMIPSAAAASDLRVSSKGELVATNVYVMQKAGSTLFTRAEWGSTYVRIIVQTSGTTKITKNHGEAASVADIEVGHWLDIEGSMLPGGDSITISASKIKDTKLLKESKEVSGTVKNIDSSKQTFMLGDKNLGEVEIIVLPSTPIIQGKRQIRFEDIKKGDKVISAAGTFDYASRILSPTSIEIHQSKNVFVKRNFQGTLKKISAATLPAQLLAVVDGVEYTIYLDEKSLLLSKNKAKTSLNRFAEGDTIRFYGGIRETNLNEIDAEIVRDLNF